MADIAANVGCSLRTLYDLAPSRDELVLTVIDRNLRRIGRGAISAIQPDLAPLVAITRALLDLAVERGDIAPTETAAVARVVAGLGAMFALPENLETIDSTPKEAADSMVDVILRGLTTGA
jgi:AcrR family transcriptional regulator